jgi:hypothetical protein
VCRVAEGTSAKAYFLVQPSVFQEVKKSSAPTEGYCDHCKRNDLESKSKLWYIGPVPFHSDSVQSILSSSHGASPALMPHNLFNTQDSWCMDNNILPPQSPATLCHCCFPPHPSPPLHQLDDNDMPSDMLNQNGKQPISKVLEQHRNEIHRQVCEGPGQAVQHQMGR